MEARSQSAAPLPEALPAGAARRSFWSLFATQFQGAFSDNAFKNLVVFFILGMGLSPAGRDTLIPVVGALFALPFILFSMAGGYLADRYSKRSVTVWTKIGEIAVMALGLLALLSGRLPFLLGVVFLMSAQSAFFGPSKWGLLPELLPEKRLSWGNGVLELGTFLSSIAGTIAGAWMSDAFRNQRAWSGAIFIALALVGLATSLRIYHLPPADPDKKFRFNFIHDLIDILRLIRLDRTLSLAVLGNTYFLFLASLLQVNIVLFGKDILQVSDTRNGLMQAAVAVGIGLGSVAAGYLSGNKIESGLVPLGSFGIVVFAAALSQPGLSFTAVLAELALLGFFGGFFIVPIAALIQHRPPREHKGGVIAASNLLSWVGYFVATGVYYLLTVHGGLDPPRIFQVGAAITLAGTVAVVVLQPSSLLRLLLWIATHTLYRIRVVGRDNIPEKGPAVFVTNHLSLLDALLLLASTDRRIRFLMERDYYEQPLVKLLARVAGVIPVSLRSRLADVFRSLEPAAGAIRNAEVVCLFADLNLAPAGQRLPLRRSLENILQGAEVPIIPVNIDRAGSLVSHVERRTNWRFPARIPCPVTVSYGPPLSPSATASEARQAVQQLHSEAFQYRKQQMLPLHRAFLRTARRHPFRFLMADGRVPALRYGAALTKTVFLARRLRTVWQGQKMVGILLPPSVPGALVNFAALLMGKIPVNLNYTSSNETLAACARQCNLETVITAKAFLEKVPIQVPARAVLLEELADTPRLGEKIAALLLAWTFPQRLLEAACGSRKAPGLDDTATVIFSSGSTGEPKGIMLSHFNIASNIAQMAEAVPFGFEDRILGILPLFHSFGFTVALSLPMTHGAGVVFHPNPLDANGIAALVRKYGVNFLIATPTFLQTYIRRCSRKDFASLEWVITGAEKLPDRVAAAFENAFGVPVLEGYGCTECAPAVAVSTRDFRALGFHQVGAKRGKVGRPLPGVSVHVVDPDTMAPLPPGQPGMLLVRGPNIMQGYLGRRDLTAQALYNGWYITGDIAILDDDGFIQITDRLSRFSKIGGEMIPHLKIEEVLHELAGVAEQSFAVAGVPDPKRGERLVVLHTLADDKLKEVLQKLADASLPNLWKPRPDQFFRVETLPYLGTGKLDLRKIREMALGHSPEP
ncbi:MAG: MFS transporter [Acidobacteria bacterium]|nr:MFS transporter [Acidobacteriota bacterium]